MTAAEDIEAELAKLTPERRQQLEQQAAMQQIMTTPVGLPTTWSVESVGTDQGPAVVLTVITPAGSIRVILLRDMALGLASDLRKAAQTGPQLITPPAAGKLVVPR